MKKSIRYTVVFDLVFLLFLIFSGAVSGVFSNVLYYLAFLIPILMFFALRPKSISEEYPLTLLPKHRNALLVLPIVAPTVLGVLLFSMLLSYLVSLLSIPEDATLVGGFFELFILHALVPALLEELMFRYIPLTLIAPHSKKSALWLSALFFSLVHCNIVQIPYAFFAGLVLAAVDIAYGSILPSVLLHLVNNTVSIFWQWERTADAFSTPALIVLSVLTVISAAFVIIYRKRYGQLFGFLADGKDRLAFSREAAVFVALAVFLTVTSLI